MTPDDRLGLHAQLACVWEATARKPGNVHRFADFADTSYLDFIASAAALAPVMARAREMSVGRIVLESAKRRREVCASNTNLGIALLLAPLARASPSPDYRADVGRVLAETGDATDVFEAIRLTQPGGLGDVGEQDVNAAPTASLLDCMALAQERDTIARQYVNGFADVFDFVAPAILAGVERTGFLEGAIVLAHLRTMAAYPDSLIARKLGVETAQESARRATMVLDADWPHAESGRNAFVKLDDWLRADGNRRNPGTTADLIAAGLFVLLRTGALPMSGAPWMMPHFFTLNSIARLE